MILSPDFSTAVRLALRTRFLFTSFWLVIAVIGTAWLGAQFSARQPATVALDVGLSVIRVLLPLMGVLLLQELISREFDRRLFLVSLTYPRPRYRFLIDRLLATLALVGFLLLVLAVALGGTVALLGKEYVQATPVALGVPYLVTLCFMAVDVFVVLAMGVLLAVVASTPNFVLIGAMGFMIIARSFSSMVTLLQRESWLMENAHQYQSSLDLLTYVVPDLASLDVRMIALYGKMDLLPANWPWQFFTALSYGVALVAFAVWALKRRRFS